MRTEDTGLFDALLACRLSPVACRLSPVACRLSPDGYKRVIASIQQETCNSTTTKDTLRRIAR
mgnify:CR=1 FL=1